jgi:hypothetical protein
VTVILDNQRGIFPNRQEIDFHRPHLIGRDAPGHELEHARDLVVCHGVAAIDGKVEAEPVQAAPDRRARHPAPGRD